MFKELILYFPSMLVNACINYINVKNIKKILSDCGEVGTEITIRDTVIKNPEGLCLGHRILFNHGCFINAAGGIKIGDDVVIGPGCIITTRNHKTKPDAERFFGNIESKPISIGNNVWLAGGVIVNPGSFIGNNVIVASGGVVTGILEDNSIYGGVPAKKIKSL